MREASRCMVIRASSDCGMVPSTLLVNSVTSAATMSGWDNCRPVSASSNAIVSADFGFKNADRKLAAAPGSDARNSRYLPALATRARHAACSVSSPGATPSTRTRARARLTGRAPRRYNNVTPRMAMDDLKSKDKLSESQAALAQRLTGAQVP